MSRLRHTPAVELNPNHSWSLFFSPPSFSHPLLEPKQDIKKEQDAPNSNCTRQSRRTEVITKEGFYVQTLRCACCLASLRKTKRSLLRRPESEDAPTLRKCICANATSLFCSSQSKKKKQEPRFLCSRRPATWTVVRVFLSLFLSVIWATAARRRGRRRSCAAS